MASHFGLAFITEKNDDKQTQINEKMRKHSRRLYKLDPDRTTANNCLHFAKIV